MVILFFLIGACGFPPSVVSIFILNLLLLPLQFNLDCFAVLCRLLHYFKKYLLDFKPALREFFSSFPPHAEDVWLVPRAPAASDIPRGLIGFLFFFCRPKCVPPFRTLKSLTFRPHEISPPFQVYSFFHAVSPMALTGPSFPCAPLFCYPFFTGRILTFPPFAQSAASVALLSYVSRLFFSFRRLSPQLSASFFGQFRILITF